jgi:restriction endonuclease S subunit
LDAEYYQKKYDDYIYLICNYPNGFEIIEVVCNQKDINYTPKDNAEYKYIELANIGKTGDIKGSTIALGCELPTRARRKVNTNDVLISSIEGSLDSCALVTEEYDNALCSTGFYIIRSNKINSETLLVLFKSEPIQNLLKKSCSGTILTAINKSEFQNIPIPIIDKHIQQQIASLVSESFILKKQSEQLLETAKRAVEIAIEESEESAMKYIEEALSH